MSIEPRRTNANDLRWRIVWHIIARGHTYQTAAKHLCVGVGTVFNIIKLFENTGEVSFTKQTISSFIN